MPTAGTRQNGPQEVPPYTYPQGELDGNGYEWVYRSGWIADDNPVPNSFHTLEITDGNGVLPTEDQPTTVEFPMGGIVQYHTKITLAFRRRVGSAGPYEPLPPTLTPPPGPGQPHTVAQ